MAVTEKILPMDQYFRQVETDKIIINDLNYFKIEDMDRINDYLMTVYETDTLSTVPSCSCGYLTSRYRKGQVCPQCGTTVKESHEKVQPVLWLRTFDPSIRLINPDFWLMFSLLFSKKVDYLRWMSDPKYNPPVELPSYMYGVREILGDERTYTNMYNNLEKIIKYLMTHSKFKEPDKQATLQLIYDLWTKHRQDIVSEYLPIINKKLFVMENTTKGRFTNLAVADVKGVVIAWLKAGSDERKTFKKLELVTARTISDLARLYYTYYDNYIVGKIGAFRKHVYGARSHFTFRNVIVSVPGKHNYDEIKVPWVIGVSVFRPMLLNLLVNRYKYSYKAASKILFQAANKYIPIVHECLLTLIRESKYKGIPVLALRNPSLLQGSSQLVYITDFYTDPEIKVVAISVLIIKAPNGDFLILLSN